MTLLKIRSVLTLQTRLGNEVENYFTDEDPGPGANLAMVDAAKQFPRARPRTNRPTGRYNCHGLTFASRRTAIEKPSEVERILSEDEYTKVVRQDVMPGDIAVYYSNGIVDHSGTVVQIGEHLSIWIVSKWGELHESVHLLTDCIYDSSDVRFFRAQK